jgi:hypothetical protein
MKLSTLITVSLVLFVHPALAAPPKAQKPSTLCTFLGDVAMDAARERDAGWTVEKSLADMKPSIARSPETLRQRYTHVVRLAYASSESPAAFKASIIDSCMTPEPTLPPQHAQRSSMTPLEQCTWLGEQAELYAQMRDDGTPLTSVITAIGVGAQRADVAELLTKLALNIYAHPQHPARQVRREREVYCINLFLNK